MPKKRADKLYEKKVTVGRDADGKLIRKSIYADSKLELERKVFDFKQECLLNKATVSDEMIFETYARSWYNNYKAVRSINTKAMYLNVIDKHLIPAIGNMYFSELMDMTAAQQIISANKAHPELCKKIKITLVQIFDQAVRDHMIEAHSMRSLSLPNGIKKEKRAITEGEKKVLLNHDWNPKQKAFLFIAYYTGARREEILALSRSDVLLDKALIRYSKTIVYDKGKATLVHGTKTQASTREVPLPAAAIQFLSEYVKDMNPDDILFPMNTGTYMSLSSYTKFWNSIRDVFAKADPDSADLTAHLLRHTYATLLYYSGISIKMAARLLGHSNVNMIMKLYAHLDEGKENPAAKINGMFD